MHTPTQPKPDFARIIAISSGKSHIGKSTLAINLSIALANAGKSVCLLDADTTQTNINALLDINPSRTLEQFYKQNLLLQDVLIKGPGDVDIIAGAHKLEPFSQLSPQHQEKLLQGLRSLERNYQYVLINAASRADKSNINLLLAAPFFLLTITGEVTSLTDSFSLLRVLRKEHFQQPVLVVVTMVTDRQSALVIYKRFMATVNKYLHLQLHFAGFVLSDKNIPDSISQKQPVLINSPDSPASQCISRICERLLTVFEKKHQTRTPFSDYFSDITTPDSVNDFSQDKESFPQSISENAEHSELVKEGSLKADRLKASQAARLLAEKKRIDDDI